MTSNHYARKLLNTKAIIADGPQSKTTDEFTEFPLYPLKAQKQRQRKNEKA